MGLKKISMWVGLLCVTQIVFAQDGIKMGEMVLNPFVTGEVSYDDNVFQAASGEEDTYGEYSVGAKLSTESDSLTFDAAGWFAQRYYNTYSDKDANRWGVSGLFSTSTDKSFTVAGANFRQVEDYDSTPLPGTIPTGFEGTVDQAFDRSISNEQRMIGDSIVGFAHDLSDVTSLSLGYKYYSVDYEDGLLEEWYENSAGIELAAVLTDKMVVFLSGQYAVQAGEGAPQDGRVSTIRVGVKNRLTDKSSVRFGIGVVDYDNEEESFTEPSFEVNALWQATEKVSVFVNGRNEVQPIGTGAGVQLASRGSLGIRGQVMQTVAIVVSGAVLYDKELNGLELENKTGIATTKLEYTPTPALNIFALGEYTDANMETGPDYTKFRATVGAGYTF